MSPTISRWVASAGLGWALAVLAAGPEIEYPFEGEVTATKLNVRSGPGENYTILSVASKGERLTVLSTKGGWHKVQLPQSVKLWVSAKYVDWTEGSEEGVVNGDRVNLRVEASAGAETLAQLSNGARLRVHKKTGDWMQVETGVADLAAWVFAKYVKGMGPAEEDSKEWVALRKDYEAERAKPLTERDLDRIVARTEALVREAANPKVKERAELFLESVRAQAEASRKIEETVKKRDEKILQIEEEYRRKLKELLSKVREPGAFLFTGWLYECGNVIGGAPGTHKLVKGGRVVAYVRGNNVALRKYYGKYVGVNGEDSYHPRYPEPVVVLQSETQIQVIGTGADE